MAPTAPHPSTASALAVGGQTSRCFPRCARLRASAEFQAVFSGGIRVSSTCFRLHAKVTGAPMARLGIAVSKRVDKRAVVRQRIKRQVREAFRLLRAQLPAADLVVVAKPGAGALDPAHLRIEIDGLLARLRALPPAALAGTMPGPAGIPANAGSHATPPSSAPAPSAPNRPESA